MQDSDSRPRMAGSEPGTAFGRCSRRVALFGFGVPVMAALALPSPGRAATEAVELKWEDLVGGSGGLSYDGMRDLGIILHGETLGLFEQETAAEVTTEYNGQQVRLPGYMVPLDYSGSGVTAFLLVPYMGACIHVPPPPPNQIVFVTTEKPFPVDDSFYPVWVTGQFSTMAVATELAEVGYTMAADDIEPYE